MPSEPKSMEDITFSVRLNTREVSMLELFIREHWLAKKLLNNSALSSYLVMYLFGLNSGGMQQIFSLLRNAFKIDQYVLVLVKGFIILFEVRE